MSKVRVYEVAREMGLDNRDFLNKVAALGIPVRNHMSALDTSDVDRIKRALEKEKVDATVEERITSTVVRRRKVAAATTPSTEIRLDEKAADPVEVAPKNIAIESTPKAEKEPAAAPVVASSESTVRGREPASQPTRETAPREATEARDSAVETPREAAKPVGNVAAQAAAVQEAPEPNEYRGSQPPPAHVRLGHSHLPPGVVARGNLTAPSAAPQSAAAISRIVTQHAQTARTSYVPDSLQRRRVQVTGSLGPSPRPMGGGGKPMQNSRMQGKRKLMPGQKMGRTEITTPGAQKRIIRIEDNIALQMLAQKMSLKATDVLMKLIQIGMGSVNINSTLDSDTAKILAGEFGYEVENVAKTDDELIAEARGAAPVEVDIELEPRSPVVTVMGHVDHGKTSLLDRIRKADVARGEAGGITQHIGAYRVETTRGTVVFLDTPGHEAFTAMRARGAQATDVVVLVVAADDGVMPQTREAVNHAKAAGVPIIVAVNKIDKHGAKPEQIRQELSGLGLQPDDWGGDTLFVNVSATTGENVDKLLEYIALQTELLELRANPKAAAEGVVLEAYLDKGRGIVANVLVQNGTLNQGDLMLSGVGLGRIRALTDERGRRLKAAGPSTPVEVIGLSDLPSAGDRFYIVSEQKKAQEIADARKKAVTAKSKAISPQGLDALYKMMQAGEVQELNLVIKSDVQGSVEALVKALTEVSTDKVQVRVIHTGVGGITENDVMLASASKAIIIGFNVRPAGQAGAMAKAEQVEIRGYSVIYEAVDDVKKAMTGLLDPVFKEKELGKAEVRQVFTIPKIGAVAGSYVIEGKILRNAKARLIRDSVQIWTGTIGSLRRVKDDAKEVTLGFECGIGLEGFGDVKERDIIECYELEKVAAVL